MTWRVVMLQVVLPFALVAWLARWPLVSWTGFGIQALGSGLMLLALSRIALWGVPPRWVIVLFQALWMVGLILALRRHFGRGPP